MKAFCTLSSSLLLILGCASSKTDEDQSATGGSNASTSANSMGGAIQSNASTGGKAQTSTVAEKGGETTTGGASNPSRNSSSTGSQPSGGTSSVSGQGGSSTFSRGGSGSSASGGSTSSAGTGTTPVDLHGQLAVVGGKLVDKFGNPVQLKGPSSMWLNWESKKFAEDKQGLQFLRDDWKASLVRAAMGITTTDTKDNDYVSAPDIAKAQVNQIVQNAIDLGMYVIIDWHDHSAETRTEAAKAFFTEMATKWGSYPNVIYETFNEPTKQDWKTVLKPYHEAVIAAIRAVDPDNVIVLGTPNWSQFVDVAAASPVTTSSNLMYTLHFYSCSHDAKVRNLAIAAITKGLPLFVTEWGATNADGGTPKNPALCLEEAQAWHDFMNANKISWAAWKWDACVDKTCFFNATADVSTTGPWTDDMLNGHAPFVRDRMRE
jgi:endoglucanase